MRRWAPAAVALLLAGCGYRFAVGEAGLPPGVERVHVPVFENRSTDAEAGAIFASALAEALAREGRAAGPGAPARVEGTVLSLEARPVAVRPDGRRDATVYRAEATLRLSVVEAGSVLCTRDLVGAEEYLPAGDPLGIEASRRQAIRRLAERLMRSAAGRLCPVARRPEIATVPPEGS